MTREQQIQTFYRHGLPGMTLKATHPPLYKRCECGQKISGNKARCNFCQQVVYRELAEQIGEDRELFQAMLDRNTKSLLERAEMTAAFRPYLKFPLE